MQWQQQVALLMALLSQCGRAPAGGVSVHVTAVPALPAAVHGGLFSTAVHAEAGERHLSALLGSDQNDMSCGSIHALDCWLITLVLSSIRSIGASHVFDGLTVLTSSPQALSLGLLTNTIILFCLTDPSWSRHCYSQPIQLLAICERSCLNWRAYRLTMRGHTCVQVQANGHHASDPSVLLTRATAPASVGSRAASPAASLASASSMLTSGSTAQQQPPLPKIVKVCDCRPHSSALIDVLTMSVLMNHDHLAPSSLKLIEHIGIPVWVVLGPQSLAA